MERGVIRSFLARACGQNLEIKSPGEIFTCHLESADRAQLASAYIRQHGIECSTKAIDRLVKNF